MKMRVSLRNQYHGFLHNLHDSQSRLMELNQQSSSQKRINKPSDDPVGMSRVLNYRSSISAIDQYRTNIDRAKGWLGLADETMLRTSAVLTRIKSLAEQGATGTMTASDRNAVAYEARQLFHQLMNLANTRFEGNSIFGGHKFEPSAYEEALMVHDEKGQSLGLATGLSTRSIMVQFLGAENATAEVGKNTISYRYSSDGGVTWQKGTVGRTGPFKLDLGGASVQLREGHKVKLSPESNTKTSSGGWLTVAPAAVYKGDNRSQAAVTYAKGDPAITAQPVGGFEKDVRVTLSAPTLGAAATATYFIGGSTTGVTVPVDRTGSVPVINTPYGGIRLMGASTANATDMEFTVHAGQTAVVQTGSTVNATGQGVFDREVMVRVANSTAVSIGSNQAIFYSYSMDGGRNWSYGHSSPNTGAPVELLVPGGKLVLSGRNGNLNLPIGTQFTIHPQTAAHNLEISTGEYLQVNNIGSEIFGGYNEYGTEPVFIESGQEKNIMLAVGKLVAALENNDQQGCGQALDSLTKCHEYFTTQMASVGARENRLMVADTVLTGLKHNETERKSKIEDVDLVTLMTDLTNQQLAYEAVLRSSSMIMRMSLMNYL